MRRAVAHTKRAKRRAKQRLGLFDPLRILPFRSYGTAERLIVMGRVLEEEGVIYETDEARSGTDKTRSPLGPVGTVRASLRRLRSDEIPGASIDIRFRGVRGEVVTDEEGYFRAELELPERVGPGWHEVTLVLVASMAGSLGAEAKARVLVPADDCDLGIISDIDDTVVRTGATNRLRLVRSVLFENADTREPFPGVADLYDALVRGPDGRSERPIFYVSRSGWNLYDLFDAFFAVHRIPPGPLLLTDLRVLEPASRALAQGEGKVDRIRDLLAAYPHMRFVLIGDSGQRDPEVYLSIAREQPSRIRAVYIRDVTSRRRDQAVKAILDQMRALGVEALAVRESREAAEHAARIGLVAQATRRDVRPSREVE